MKSNHECPELVKLAVDDDKKNGKWVHYAAHGQYFIGDFDGKNFTKESEETPLQLRRHVLRFSDVQ